MNPDFDQQPGNSRGHDAARRQSKRYDLRRRTTQLHRPGRRGSRPRSTCPIVLSTVAMDSVEFRQPVFVGDVLSFYAAVKRIGRTSITMRVNVRAERFLNPREVVSVTEAVITYVSVDENRKPIPHGLTPTSPTSDSAARDS